MNAITPTAVRAQLGRILVSEAFVRSPRMQRFLEFVVEEKLAGREDQLGEYGVGTAVFDRGADFEPATDPIVRNEARRLRLKLCEYYRTASAEDQVLIDVPKGGYAPSFGSPVSQAVRRATARRIAVLPLDVLSATPETSGQTRAFASLLTARLTNLDGIETVAHRFVQDHAIRDTVAELSVSHVVHGSAIEIDGQWRMVVNLTLAAEGTQVWAGEFEFHQSESFQAHSHIAAAVIREVSGHLTGRRPERLALVA